MICTHAYDMNMCRTTRIKSVRTLVLSAIYHANRPGVMTVIRGIIIIENNCKEEDIGRDYHLIVILISEEFKHGENKEQTVKGHGKSSSVKSYRFPWSSLVNRQSCSGQDRTHWHVRLEFETVPWACKLLLFRLSERQHFKVGSGYLIIGAGHRDELMVSD